MTYRPKIPFERARLQQGYFIYQAFSKFSQNAIQHINHDELIKIENPSKILRELENIGINYGTLFGDYDSIAKYVKGKHFPKTNFISETKTI